MALVARSWGTSPSVLAGLPRGSAEAYVLDRGLALRLTERERDDGGQEHHA